MCFSFVDVATRLYVRVLVVAAIVWIVTMALSSEWPKHGENYLRRYGGHARSADRHATSVYVPVAQILKGPHTSCPGSRRRAFGFNDAYDGPAQWDWICGNIPGTAAYLDPIADVQIAALSLFPVVAVLGVSLVWVTRQQRSMLHELRMKRSTALLYLSAAVLGLGLFISITLFVTAGRLADFNATGGGVPDIVAPASVGWATSPGLLNGFAGCVLAIAVLGAATGLVAWRRTAATEDEQEHEQEQEDAVAPPSPANDAGVDAESRRDDDAAVPPITAATRRSDDPRRPDAAGGPRTAVEVLVLAQPVPPGVRPVDAYVVDGVVVA